MRLDLNSSSSSCFLFILSVLCPFSPTSFESTDCFFLLVYFASTFGLLYDFVKFFSFLLGFTKYIVNIYECIIPFYVK